jgi:hypothetical protein
MEADLFLADAASLSDDGKVSAIGFGWTTVSSPLAQFALVAFIRVPRQLLGKRLNVALHLHAVRGGRVIKNQGGQPIRAEGWLHVDSRVDVDGIDYETPVAVTIPPGITLKRGVYEWRLDVNGKDSARRRFLVVGERVVDPPPGT